MSNDKDQKGVPPGFTPEAWAAIEAQIDRHAKDDGTVDTDAFNAEAQRNIEARDRKDKAQE
jgi:hypothetical protein